MEYIVPTITTLTTVLANPYVRQIYGAYLIGRQAVDTTCFIWSVTKNIFWVAYKTGEGATRLVMFTAGKALPAITHKNNNDIVFKVIESTDEYQIVELVEFN